MEKTVDKKRLQPVRVDNLIPGMSLGTDVFSANGTFLLAKGTIINESSINLLESNYVFSVYIDEKPHVHFHFIPRYRNELKLFDKIYKDKHFGYNFWKWDLSEQEKQQDIFTKEERVKIFKMMKEEFNYE